MEDVFLTVEGTRVYGQYHAADGGRSAAILLHGFRSSLREFGTLPGRLAAAGVHALAIDHRGHGLSHGERGRVGLDRALADTEAAVAYLRERLGRRARIALVGHSLGGAHAVGIASRTDTFAALVVAHPVDCLFDELNVAERAAYHALGRLGQRRMRRGRAAGSIPRLPLYASMYVDRAARRRARDQGLLQTRVNLANYSYALTMRASDWARHVTVPALAVSSDDDRVVDPGHSEDVFSALAGDVERLRHRGGHSCFLDADGARVADGVADFLRRRLGVRG